MKKIVLIFILLKIFVDISCQNYKLTIEQTVLGSQYGLFPHNYQNINWIDTTSNYSYVADYQYIISGNLFDNHCDTLLSLMELNTKLNNENNTVPFKYILDYDWIGDTKLLISNVQQVVIYDIIKKDIEFVFCSNDNEEAQYFDFSSKANALAFTKENNLFMQEVNKSAINLTGDKRRYYVYGQPVSREEFGIEKGTFWSPKGNYLAFYRKDESNIIQLPVINIEDSCVKAELFRYPMAGTLSEHVSLGIYNMHTGSTVYIEEDTITEKYLTCVTWGPNEKYIYIAVLNREQNYLKLNQYNVQNGKYVKTLFEEKNSPYVEPEHPLYFIENRIDEFIWFSERNDYQHLYHYNTDGILLSQITKGDWTVTELLGCDKDGENVFFISTAESPLERHIYKVNISEHTMEKLSDIAGVHMAILSSDRKYIIDNVQSTKIPRKISIIDAKGEPVKQMLLANDPFSDFSIGQTEIFQVKAADQITDLYCRIIKPPKFNKKTKYPMIVYVYGGPHEQLILNTWLGGAELFDLYLAQQGFVVVSVDNRGSESRGYDFESITYKQLGILEMEDQMQAIQYMKNKEYIDTNRIGVFGWSFGGYMTISLMLHYPDIFKVGVAGGPVTNWKYYEVMYGERYMDKPINNPIGYEKTNLINKVSDLKGKLLIIHGGMDKTVVPQHSLKFIQKCIEEKKQVDYFLYPTHEHNVIGIDRIHLNQKIYQYFRDYL